MIAQQRASRDPKMSTPPERVSSSPFRSDETQVSQHSSTAACTVCRGKPVCRAWSSAWLGFRGKGSTKDCTSIYEESRQQSHGAWKASWQTWKVTAKLTLHMNPTCKPSMYFMLQVMCTLDGRRHRVCCGKARANLVVAQCCLDTEHMKRYSRC